MRRLNLFKAGCGLSARGWPAAWRNVARRAAVARYDSGILAAGSYASGVKSARCQYRNPAASYGALSAVWRLG